RPVVKSIASWAVKGKASRFHCNFKISNLSCDLYSLAHVVAPGVETALDSLDTLNPEYLNKLLRGR
ncbi:MAG: hypothetical protein JXQ83_08310, partial [Candidatus Glassbacteria bacterium]|nr:hypothetical protein [Candidatus Glassbacteria bacterium]